MDAYKITRVLAQLKRLEENFSKSFSKHQMASIRSIAEHVGQEDLQRVVDQFINTKRTLPLPVDFYDALGSKHRYRPESSPEGYRPDPSCPKCWDSSILWIGPEDSPDEEPVAVYCNCEVGRAGGLWKIPSLGEIDRTGFVFRDYSKSFVLRQDIDLWKKADQWKRKIKKSEEFWSEVAA